MASLRRCQRFYAGHLDAGIGVGRAERPGGQTLVVAHIDDVDIWSPDDGRHGPVLADVAVGGRLDGRDIVATADGLKI